MPRRLSRGTPHILTDSEVREILKAVSTTPRVRDAIAALMGMTPREWERQQERKRVKQILDYQSTGLIAATLTQAARAHTDLEDAALPVTRAEEADLLRDQVDELNQRIRTLENQTRKDNR